MKKFLLSMLTIGMICSSVVAQKDVLPLNGKAMTKGINVTNNATGPDKNIFPIPFNNSPSLLLGELPEEVVPVEAKYLTIGNLSFQNRYDRQSQGNPYEMMYVHKDQFVGAAWTAASHDEGNLETRGISYACLKPGATTWEMEFPVGDQYYTYWPSYLPWGKEGELIVVRVYDDTGAGGINHDGLGVFRREKKGEGEWEFQTFENPTDNGADGVMVWQRCCVTGENNEYLHVATGFSLNSGSWNGYTNPMIYNRSSDGGKTWDFDWTILPDLVGQTWDLDFNYTEDIAWAEPHGSSIALIGATLSQDCIIMKSDNHGAKGSWEKITVYECATDMNPGPDQKVDSGYRALMADVAFDNEGRLHAVMSVIWARPDTETANSFYWSGRVDFCGLLYWNEGRGTYTLEEIDPIFDDWRMNFFYTFEENGEGMISLGAVSKRMTEYLVAGAVPITDTEGEVADNGVTYYEYNWITTEADMLAMKNYRQIGMYAWAQIFFDKDNGLNLIYAGPLDGAEDGDGYQRRHIFHTYTKDEFKTFNHHKDMNDFLAVRNGEFAYPYVGGWMYDGQFMYIAQVDPMVGTHMGGSPDPGFIHSPSNNVMYAFTGTYKEPGSIKESAPSIAMSVYPNPAQNTVTVSFDGKCNIEIYNMVGQKVYQVENASQSHQVSLENLPRGVYFVTVRDGKKASTQKLIVQ